VLIIAERINASRKRIAAALAARDASAIQDEARRQADAGADFIDVNTALSPKEERDLMVWAVETVRAVTDKPLAIDSADPKTTRAGLALLPKGSAFLNSISGETGRLGPMLELAAEFQTRVVAMAMDDHGMPESVQDRWRALEGIFAATDKAGIPREHLYVDPLVRPVSTNPEQVAEVLATIRRIRADGGGAQTTCGLSNISFGLPKRRHLNRTFLAMAAGAGLASAILDPLEADLVTTALAAGCLTGEDAFCMAYITAEREGRL
jgi:5-methyltetrahydrofolate--homocysteine methyltransferase